MWSRRAAFAKRGHGIHYPFVFNLVLKVFRNKISSDIVCKIETIRKKLISDRRTIMYKINAKQHISENYKPIEVSAIENEKGLASWFDGDFYPLLAVGGCLHQLFENTVKKYPESFAVQFNNETLTYSELNKKANRLARYLKSLGVGAVDFAGILLSRTPYMYIAML